MDAEGDDVDALRRAHAQPAASGQLLHFIGPDGRVTGGIELRIPPSVPRWRTWAYTKNAKEPGLWHIEIRNPDGALIGALPFEVDPGC